MSQIPPCLAHLWGLKQPPPSAPPPESPLAALAPPGGSREAASLQVPTAVSAPGSLGEGKGKGLPILPLGSQLKGGAQPCTGPRDPLLPSLPQSSPGSRGALSTVLPVTPPEGADRWRRGLEVQPHALALKRQERLGLAGLAEEALCESLALSLTAAGRPGPTTGSPATRQENGTTSGCGGVCALQGLPGPALLPTAHSRDRPVGSGVHG